VNGVTLTDAGWFNDLDAFAYQDVLNVKNSAYGALGDGITNDASAIQTALTAGTGGFVFFPEATYKINSALTIPINTSIVFADGVVIDASSATFGSPGLISAQGTISAAIGGGLTGSVNPGATSLSFNSAPGVVAGDLIIINDPAAGSWHPSISSYKQGEYLEVKSISGNVIQLVSATLGTYAASSDVYIVTPTSTRIIGNSEIRGNVSGTENLATVYIKYGRDNLVDGIRFKNTVGTCIETAACYSPRIINVDTGKYLTDAGGIQSTGVILGGQYGICRDSNLVADRHGGSTGSGNGGLLVDRFNVFDHCHIASRTAAAADFHAAAEFCEYRNCHIDGGINYSGARNKIVGNKVYPGTALTLINFEFVRSIDCEIENNRFYRRAAGYVVDGNDTSDINADTVDDGVFRFRNNWIEDSVAGDASYIFLRNNGSTAECRIEITDNHFIKTNTSFYGDVLSVSKVTGNAFSSLVFEDNELVNCSFGVSHADDQFFAGNFGTRNASDTQAITISGDAGNIHIEDNVLKGGGVLQVNLIGGGANSKLVVLKNNSITLTNPTGNIPVVITGAEVVVSQGNTLGSDSDASQTNPISFVTIDSLTIAGDTYIGEGPPAFSGAFVAPSNFSFQKKVSLTTPATTFTVWTIPTNMSFLPTLVQGRADTDVTATNTEFWALGVNASNRRIDYGICTTAAATSKHSKNAKMRYCSAPADSVQMADSAEVIALNSVTTNADAAVLGANIGGSSQTITFRIAGTLIGNLPDLP